MIETSCRPEGEQRGHRPDRLELLRARCFRRALPWILAIIVGAATVGADRCPLEVQLRAGGQYWCYGWPAEHTHCFIVNMPFRTGFASWSSRWSTSRTFCRKEAAWDVACGLVLVLSTLYVMTRALRSSDRAFQFSLPQLLLFVAVLAAMLGSRSVVHAIIALFRKPIWVIVPVVFGLICVVLAATSVANRLMQLARKLWLNGYIISWELRDAGDADSRH